MVPRGMGLAQNVAIQVKGGAFDNAVLEGKFSYDPPEVLSYQPRNGAPRGAQIVTIYVIYTHTHTHTHTHICVCVCVGVCVCVCVCIGVCRGADSHGLWPQLWTRRHLARHFSRWAHLPRVLLGTCIVKRPQYSAFLQ